MATSRPRAIQSADWFLLLAVSICTVFFIISYVQWTLYRTTALPGELCLRQLDVECAVAELMDPEIRYRSALQNGEWYWAVHYLLDEGSMEDRLQRMVEHELIPGMIRARGTSQLEAIARVGQIINVLEAGEEARAYVNSLHASIGSLQSFNPIQQYRVFQTPFAPFCHTDDAMREMLQWTQYKNHDVSAYSLHPCYLKYFALADVEASEFEGFVVRHLEYLRAQRRRYGEYEHSLGLQPTRRGAPTDAYLNALAYLTAMLLYRENYPEMRLGSA